MEDKDIRDTVIEARLFDLNAKLDDMEEHLAKMLVDTEELKARMDHLEESFVDELAKNAKDKFDTFREYLASKIRP